MTIGNKPCPCRNRRHRCHRANSRRSLTNLELNYFEKVLTSFARRRSGLIAERWTKLLLIFNSQYPVTADIKHAKSLPPRFSRLPWRKMYYPVETTFFFENDLLTFARNHPSFIRVLPSTDGPVRTGPTQGTNVIFRRCDASAYLYLAQIKDTFIPQNIVY